MRQHGVDRLPAESRAPVFAVRVIPEPTNQLERHSPVGRLPQRGRLRTGVHDIRLTSRPRLDLPDALERLLGVLGKADRSLRWLGPGLAEVVGVEDSGAPVFAGATREQPWLIAAGIDAHGVHALHLELRPVERPFLALGVAVSDPESLLGPDQQYGLGHLCPLRVVTAAAPPRR